MWARRFVTERMLVAGWRRPPAPSSGHIFAVDGGFMAS
jgi:hypothetical protein